MTSQLRAVAPAAVIFFAVLAVTAAAADENAAPTFRVENTELDLGTIVAGSEATATFVFHNDGPDDVRIIRAKPS